MPDVPPSPRDVNTRLLALGDEAATLIFAGLKSAKPKLNRETIDSLARHETSIPMNHLSLALRSRVDPGKSDKLSHSQLIKALFLPSLSRSEVGKTLVAMRKMVMLQYDGATLTLAQRAQIEEKDPGFKVRMQANIAQQAKACAAIALGHVGPGQAPALSASKLPPELIAFWITMDRKLCEWAAENPALHASQLRTARENLGFDILFTRLILPLALGSKEDSHLVIPMIFYDAVKDALKADWPAFVDSFMVAADSRADASGPQHKQRATRTPSTTSTTSTVSTTTTTSPSPRLQPADRSNPTN